MIRRLLRGIYAAHMNLRFTTARAGRLPSEEELRAAGSFLELVFYRDGLRVRECGRMNGYWASAHEETVRRVRGELLKGGGR